MTEQVATAVRGAAAIRASVAVRVRPELVATLSPEVAASLFGLGDEEKPREHLTVNEAAEMLRVVPQTIHHMIRDGRLRAQRVCGKRVLIKREEVLRCFEPIEPQTYEPD